VVPLKRAAVKSSVMIDNRDNESVLMVVNDSPFASPISFTVTCKDNMGKIVPLDQITLAQNASMIFNLKEKWPILEKFVGAVEFTSANSTIVLSAIRINPTNSFTPLPTFEY
jgi:hypothetical protein